jgi:energy-coupling factor transport system substrate-specific component
MGWSAVPFIAANLSGVLAFALPFFLAFPRASEAGARSADAPWLLTLLAPLLIAVAISEAGGRRLDAKKVALLGILAALAGLMRLPVSIAGANLMFFLPIVGGFVFGASFGFLLGALAMAASAVMSGGIGPWLPFQMWAAGWVGAGAGLLKPLGDRWSQHPVWSVLALAFFGYVAGLAYGAVINLYFWPVLAFGSEIGWSPSLGLAETLERYLRFYLLTSLPWDAFRGVGNAALILIAGRPVIELLRRYKRRFTFEVEWTPAESRPLMPASQGYQRAV